MLKFADFNVSFSHRKDSTSSLDNNENNLTDSTKVRLLHRQLETLQSQPLDDRRKYSDIRRYWSDSNGLNSMALDGNELYRTTSSPSILGKHSP